MNASPTLAPPARLPLKQAGFVSRAVALILDILFVTMGSIVFAALASLILNFFGFNAESLTTDDPTTFLGMIQVIIVAMSSLAVLLFVPGYFVIFWVLVGATPGKQILGLRIIRTDTSPLGWSRAVLRYIGYFISAIVFFLGYLWVFVDDRRMAWHDKLADTFVVYSWDVAQAEATLAKPLTR